MGSTTPRVPCARRLRGSRSLGATSVLGYALAPRDPTPPALQVFLQPDPPTAPLGTLARGNQTPSSCPRSARLPPPPALRVHPPRRADRIASARPHAGRA